MKRKTVWLLVLMVALFLPLKAVSGFYYCVSR